MDHVEVKQENSICNRIRRVMYVRLFDIDRSFNASQLALKGIKLLWNSIRLSLVNNSLN